MRLPTRAGEQVQIEFVSANPTGPLHVGNGWLGSYGDALGRVMSRCGWDVRREFYVNDTGGQIRLLGESLLAAPSRRRRAGGGLSGRVRHPPRAGLRRARGRRRSRAASRARRSSRTYGRRSTGSTSVSTSGTRKPRSRRAARLPRRSSCSVRGGSCTRRTERSGSGPPRSATAATAC